jgi:CBS domain-containing protein
MKDNKIGGVPVVEGPKRKLVGSVSIRDIRFLLLRPNLFSNFRYQAILQRVPVFFFVMHPLCLDGFFHTGS